jgi:hypothetical protein
MSGTAAEREGRRVDLRPVEVAAHFVHGSLSDRSFTVTVEAP